MAVGLIVPMLDRAYAADSGGSEYMAMAAWFGEPGHGPLLLNPAPASGCIRLDMRWIKLLHTLVECCDDDDDEQGLRREHMEMTPKSAGGVKHCQASVMMMFGFYVGMLHRMPDRMPCVWGILIYCSCVRLCEPYLHKLCTPGLPDTWWAT